MCLFALGAFSTEGAEDPFGAGSRVLPTVMKL